MVSTAAAGSAISDPGPDAELIAALDDTVVRAVLGALRSGPRTVGELAASTGHDAPAVRAALHSLTEQGVVIAEAPRVPGEVVHRIDGAALTGFRGLGRWVRARSSAPTDGRRVAVESPGTAPAAGGSRSGDAGRDEQAERDDETGPNGEAGEDPTAHPPAAQSAGAGPAAGRAAVDPRPSVSAWTNPAVKAALRRLEEQQRRSR